MLGIVIAAGAIAFAYRTVAKPISELAGVVGDLTATEKEVVGAAPGARRRDRPHGALAAVVPPGPLDMEALRREQQQESEQRAQRGEQLGKLTADFEQRIGGIVGTVTTAATQLEAAAGTLSQHRRIRAAAVRHGRGGLGGGVLQRAVGRERRPRR